MEQPNKEALPVVNPLLLDILETNAPALSATSDMPVVETKPDSLPVEKVKKEAVPPDEGEAEQSEESATPATEELPGQPAKARGVGKKIQELTARIDAERQEKLRLMALLEARETKPVEKPEPELVKPDRNAFSDPDAYDTAMLEFAEKRAKDTAIREFERLKSEEAEKASQEMRAQADKRQKDEYASRVEKVREKYADFEEVAQSPDVRVPMPVVHAIMTLEQGPELQYYFGKNPAEAERLTTYQIDGQPDIARQLMEVGLILAKINTPKAAPISNAPAPIRPVKSSSVPVEKEPEKMSMDEYKAWRKSGGGK